MSHLQIAERWLSTEARRRANFKQQLQNLEHNEDLGRKAEVEDEIETLLRKSGNPWRIVVEDVEKDLFVTNFTRLDGYGRMVWTIAHFDRNHWNPEDPMSSIEVFVANEYRRLHLQPLPVRDAHPPGVCTVRRKEYQAKGLGIVGIASNDTRSFRRTAPRG